MSTQPQERPDYGRIAQLERQNGIQQTPRSDPASYDLGQIERLPWSVLGPEFAAVWGRADPADPQPEHVEVIGVNGSGKTHFICKILQDRMVVRNTPEVLVLTKPADKTVQRLIAGNTYKIVDQIKDVRRHRQCIYWPRTNRLGRERKAYQAKKIEELLDWAWVPNSNRIMYFDEIAYIESLDPDIRTTMEMYWRESRSQGITMVAGKQRPQGANRHMHSETKWTIAFVPADQADKERFAELFGSRKEWLPVFEQLDPNNHEFLIRHTVTRQVYISWIDEELIPIENPWEKQ